MAVIIIGALAWALVLIRTMYRQCRGSRQGRIPGTDAVPE